MAKFARFLNSAKKCLWNEIMGFYDSINTKEMYANAKYDDMPMGDNEALALLGRLFSRTFKRGSPNYNKLSGFLTNWLPDILSAPGLGDNKLKDSFGRLGHLSAAIMENCRLPILQGKPLIGIGGAYSAGKSRFLNAITGMKGAAKLPEGQGATTAIGTYLIHGEKFAIQAHTKSDSLEELSAMDLDAISHKFYEAYKIGFADVLHKLIITSPDFRPDIILLDTPGYTKSDNGAKNDGNAVEPTDKRVARDHLRNCDFIIWLVEIGQGAIRKEDLDFLKDLNIKNPCLVIFNKADIKDMEEIRKIVESAENTMRSEALPCFGVTAYSSSEGREYLERGLIAKFLDNARASKPFSASRELENLRRQWLECFERKSAETENNLQSIEKAILQTDSLANIQGLLASYSLFNREGSALYHDKNNFEREMEKFGKALGQFLQEPMA